MSRRLSCPQGHDWSSVADDASPEDSTDCCPVCGEQAQTRLGQDTPEFSERDRLPAESPFPQIPGYEMLSLLGRGGMGVVYKARQQSLQRLVALKIMRGGAQADAEERQRFQNEAEAVAHLQHANIVQIHEVGQHDGLPYFAAEFAAGGTLGQRANGTPQRPHDAAQVVEVLARAMQYAHERGIIHRDLKPANVLLSFSGEPEATGQAVACGSPLNGILKITDFGLAKRLEGFAGAPAQTLTQSGAIVGTPSYMAPEQASGMCERITPAVDIYALGAILYELLTGRPPFRAETPLDTVLQVLTEEPAPPRLLQTKVPRDLETICLKCLEKDPKRRYGTALDLAEDVRRFMNGEPIRARPVGKLERGWRWCRRKPMVAALLTVCVLLLIGGIAGIAWKWLEAETYAEQAEKRRAQAEENYRLALENNIAVRDLAEELRPLVGTQATIVERLLNLAIQNHEALLDKAGRSQPALAAKGQILNSASDLFSELGLSAKALAAAQEAHAIYVQLVGEQKHNRLWRSGLAASLTNLARALGSQGRFAKAQDALRAAAAIQEKLSHETPDDPEVQVDLAKTLLYLGSTLEYQADFLGAEVAFRKRLGLLEAAVARSSAPLAWQRTLALACDKVASCDDRHAEYRQEQELLEKALMLLLALEKTHPDNTLLQRNHAQIALNLGLFHQFQADGARAVKHFQESLTIAERLLLSDPRNPSLLELKFNSQSGLADVLQTGSRVEALNAQLDFLQSMVPAAEARLQKDPDNFFHKLQLASRHGNIGRTLIGLAQQDVDRSDNLGKAIEHLTTALAMEEALAPIDPTGIPGIEGQAGICNSLHSAFRLKGDLDAAQAARERGAKLRIDFFAARRKHEPGNPAWQFGWAQAIRSWANLAGNSKQAHERYDTAIAALKSLAQTNPAEATFQQELALTYEQAGDQQAKLKETLRLRRQAHVIRENLATQFPHRYSLQLDLADSYRRLYGLVNAVDGNRAEALATYQKFLDQVARMFTIDAVRAQRYVFGDDGAAASSSATVLTLENHLSLQKNSRIQLKLAEKQYQNRPDSLNAGEVLEACRTLVGSCLNLARLRGDKGQPDFVEARKILQRGLEVLGDLDKNKQSHPVHARWQAYFQSRLREMSEQ